MSGINHNVRHKVLFLPFFVMFGKLSKIFYSGVFWV